MKTLAAKTGEVVNIPAPRAQGVLASLINTEIRDVSRQLD